MTSIKRITKKAMSYLLAVTLVLSMAITLPVSVNATRETSLDYAFSGKNADDAGYAQGTVTFTSDTDGTFYLYWADDTKALDGYYEIDELTVADGEPATFEFGNHTAIPAGATKLIAVSDKSDLTVESAKAAYQIPSDKQLYSSSEPATTEPTDDVTYVLYIAPEQSLIDSGITFKANVKDSSGSYHSYTFVQTDMTYNGASVYKAEITNPAFTYVIKIQFQTWDSSNTFVGQVIDEKSVPLSDYDNKIMVCSSAKIGELNSFIAD